VDGGGTRHKEQGHILLKAFASRLSVGFQIKTRSGQVRLVDVAPTLWNSLGSIGGIQARL
jgi:hypothetical protein